MGAAMKTYIPENKEESAKVRREAMDLVTSDREEYGRRVLRRLEGKPRYQSIGRLKYVYVGDIEEALAKELNSDIVGEE